MAKAFTAADVDSSLTAKARPATGRREIAIGEGLDLVIFPSGPGRYRYRYRPRGKDQETGLRYTQRKAPIGDTETHSLKEAKTAAAELRLRVTKGHDPATADRAAAAASRAAVLAADREAKLDAAAKVTGRDKLDQYKAVLTTRGRSEKHQREELAQVRLALTRGGLLDVPPSDLTQAHVEKIMAGCPVRSQALRFGALDRFLRWACRGQSAPATASFDRHERPSLPPARQRVLSSAEVAAIWTAAETLRQDVLTGLVCFLISTPCREGEAAAATWGDINLAERTWTMPTSKNGRPHRFPLSDRAVAILEARRKAIGDAATPERLIFAAPRSGRVFMGWSNLKGSLDERLEKAAAAGTGASVKSTTIKSPKAKSDKVSPATLVEPAFVPWRFHDLRRTAATALGEAGCDDSLVDMLLNHTAAGTRSVLTRTYNVSQRWDDRVRALATWGQWIDAALGVSENGDAANVADINEARRRAA